MSIKKDLQKADEYLTRAKECVVSIEQYIEKKKEQLAKKPEMRHGHCCITTHGRPVIHIGNGKDSVAFFEDGHSEPFGRRQDGHHTKDGKSIHFNAFDTLKRYAVDLTRFEIVDSDDIGGRTLKAQITTNNNIEFCISGCHSTHRITSAIEIHQKLGQLIATAKRQA